MVLPLAILLVGSVKALAAYTYSPISTTNPQESYSPDTISGRMGYDDRDLELMTQAFNMKWSLTRINNLRNYQAKDQYYTIDISVNNDYDTTVSAYTSTHYTDLPGPIFDTDDDGGLLGNGYVDETEVTVTRPDRLQALQAYQFISYWGVFDTSGTTFEWNSQLSEPFLGEYNAVDYEFHFEKTFPWW